MEMKDELDRDIERLRTYDHIIQSFKYLLLMHMIIFVGETNCVFVLKSVIVRKWTRKTENTFVRLLFASAMHHQISDTTILYVNCRRFIRHKRNERKGKRKKDLKFLELLTPQLNHQPPTTSTVPSLAKTDHHSFSWLSLKVPTAYESSWDIVIMGG